jgi:hypothetical protein
MHDRGHRELLFLLYLAAVFFGGVVFVARHFHDDEMGARSVVGAAACFLLAEAVAWHGRRQRRRGRPR